MSDVFEENFRDLVFRARCTCSRLGTVSAIDCPNHYNCPGCGCLVEIVQGTKPAPDKRPRCRVCTGEEEATVFRSDPDGTLTRVR